MPMTFPWTSIFRSTLAFAALYIFANATAAAIYASGQGQMFKPGKYDQPPTGIDSVKGECAGKIALTPTPKFFHGGYPYAVIYHCSTKTFEILKTNQRGATLVSLNDLTLTHNGYYLHEGKITNQRWKGEYVFYDVEGNRTRAIEDPRDPKVHDLFVEDTNLTRIRYVPDWDAARCGRAAPLEMEITTEDLNGKILWTWSTKGRFDIGRNVSTVQSTYAPAIPGWRQMLHAIRHCYTSIVRSGFDITLPDLSTLRQNGLTFFKLEVEDHIHANSIQRLESAEDILVSAKHLDTVFVIDRRSGAIKWMLGGKFAKATANRPRGDPRGGFSHPHYARIEGNMLWVFDNGNLFPHLPSRVVGYLLTSGQLPVRMAFEMQEPNGIRRPELGSVQLLQNDQLLIGWGGYDYSEATKPQRGVSIVRTADRREVFTIDFSPGWMSYRAKALQP